MKKLICLVSLCAIALTALNGCAGVDPYPLKKHFESEVEAYSWPEGAVSYSVSEYKGRRSLSIYVSPDYTTKQELSEMVALAKSQVAQASDSGLHNTSVSVRTRVNGMNVNSDYSSELGTLEEVAGLPRGFATKAELNLAGKGVTLDLAACTNSECTTEQASHMATALSTVHQAQIAGFLPDASNEENVFIHFNIVSAEGEKEYQLRLDSTNDHHATAADLSELMQLRSELDTVASPAIAYSLFGGAKFSRALVSSWGTEQRLDEQEVERIRDSAIRAACGRIKTLEITHQGYERMSIDVGQQPECA